MKTDKSKWLFTFGVLGLIALVGCPPPSPTTSDIKWLQAANTRAQVVRSQHNEFLMYRVKVPGGWLVGDRQITFYPDPQHLWLGDQWDNLGLTYDGTVEKADK